MAVKLRLARWGARKNPYYHIVASDSRSPRDGKYLETVGKYNPMLPSEEGKNIVLKEERIKHWLSVGAIPTDKVHNIFAKAGLVAKKAYTVKTKKSLPKAKAQERLKALEAKNIEAAPQA
ncbi:30S ribosomal protein S16 [Candidatus Hepatincolaceae symbiont of Richtersius coronifer]